MNAFGLRNTLWTLSACVIVLGLGLGACSTNTSQKARSTPAATRVATAYPTPSVWRQFTYSGLVTMAYPFGWAQTSYLTNTEIFSASAGGYAPDSHLVVSLSASSAAADISSFCPAHPTTAVATLPAAQSSGYDASRRPYYEWTAANESIGIRFIVTFGSEIGASTLTQLSSYREIYTHMLQSITIPTQVAHAAACGAS